MLRTPVLFVMALALCACSSRERAPAAPPATAATPVGRFTVNEWGLFGLDIASESQLAAASGSQVSPRVEGTPIGSDPMSTFGDLLGDEIGRNGSGGLGVGGGKPVVYVHLDDGVDSARFSLALGIGGDRVLEHRPTGVVTPTRLTFGPFDVRRGRCAAEAPAPIGTSRECATRDGYCEAAEIGRYHGDDDTCLVGGGRESPFLFYRAGGLDASRLPLVLVRGTDGYEVRNRATEVVAGPVLFVARRADGTARYRVLDPSERNGAIPTEGSLEGPSAARVLLTDHARSIGLRESEADAFVDAWAPALFDACHRNGAEATGAAPVAFGEADVSLLYFAPRAVVDALLPLTTDPPARETNRAFLVRVVDGPRPRSLGTLEHGGGYGTPSQLHGNSLSLRVDVTRPVVRGPLTADAVLRVVRRNLAQVRYCYERAFANDPELRGAIAIEVAISGSGSVAASSVRSSTVRDDEVARCVVAATRRWSYPASDDGAVTIATLRYEFSAPSR